MLRNLPENLKGSVAFPITISLDKGICVELHYNGSMFQNGMGWEDFSRSIFLETNFLYQRVSAEHEPHVSV